MHVHRFAAAAVTLAIVGASQALAAPDCSLRTIPQPLPQRATALPPLSDELPAGNHQLGVSEDVFAYGSDEGQAVDRVLARLRDEACKPAPQPGGGPDAAGYVPRTKWDNTPYRFNAGGNGKKFSAAEFSAWMESKGIHVSKGAPQPVTPTSATQPATTQPDAAQPGTTQPNQ
ncbi:MAG TPA: hypothetical protein VGH80_10100 [Xanthomonadaceae bacterium]|jgi:hypothetical protein